MDDFKWFVGTMEAAISAFRYHRKGLYRSARARPIVDRLRENAARRLRRASAKLTEIDVDVMDDLMKVVKKLGRQTTSVNGLETRFKLTLDLLPYVFDKGRNTTPDLLLYRFMEIYRGLARAIPESAIIPVSKGGV